ncbi:type IV secretion system protein TraC [Gilliamella sp. BG7]|uniref:type IV secretion system protein TraC n=1 Tax=unclassified Gilliamella TaxID=2685620 RepID=UPI00398606F7
MKRRKPKKINNNFSFDSIIKLFRDNFYNIKNDIIKRTNKTGDNILDTLLDYPSLSDFLPYFSYDPECNIFINKNSLGFILEIDPLIGANESIVKSLDEFFRTKLPRKEVLQVTLLSSKEIKNILDNGLKHEKWSGDNASHFNNITSAYYQNAALNHFDNARDYGLTLRNYRVFITYGEERKGNLSTQIKNMESWLKIIKSGLEGSFLFGNPLDPKGLINLVSEIVNMDMNSVVNSVCNYDENETIDKQCISKATQLIVEKNNLKITSNKKDTVGMTETIVTNYMINGNPDTFFLGASANNIGSLISPSLMISCPFIVTFIIEIEEQAKSANEMTTKFLDRNKKSQTSFATFVPSVKREAEEYGKLRERLNSNISSLAIYYFNVTVFSKNYDEAKKNEQDVLNCYRNNGIQLSVTEFMNFVNFSASLPFMAHEGIWHDLKHINATNRSEVVQAVNLMPVVAENKLAQYGFLAPSFRNQISFINLFDMGTENYNCAICGTAGAGKSVITQAILYDVLKRGGREWIIDLGGSYKNYCEIVGGEYWDVAKLRFNPFANIAVDLDKEDLTRNLKQINIDEDSPEAMLAASLNKIHKLVLVMADPEGTYLDRVSEAIFYDAVEYAYFNYKNKALIDHIVEYFEKERAKENKYKENTLVRFDEATLLLKKYTTKGIYGKYFNSDTATLTGDAQLTVLELGSLQNTPDLLATTLFTLIISIDEYMYQTSRAVPKVCAIDEAWRLLGGKSQRVATFIEVGYRTSRKHKGSFITITQGLNDFALSSAASAAWDNSAIKIIAKQDNLAVESYVTKNPNFFKKNQLELLKTFGNASVNGFSSFLLATHGDMFPCRLFLDPLRRTLFSSTGEDFEYIQNARRNNIDISQAIYDRACIKYSDEIRGLEEWITERQLH